MSGLIIEGVCATGKSTILSKLTNRDFYISKKSKIQLSEHLTERVIENVNPTLKERIGLLEQYVDMFESIKSTFHNSRFKNTGQSDIIPCYLAERFHFTHGIEVGSFGEFKSIDTRLNGLDFKVIALTMDEHAIKERLEDTFKRRNKMWYNYVMSFGGLEGASEKYYKMQKTLLEYIEQTSLPVKAINTTNMDWDKYVDEIEKFWNR